MAGHGRRNDHDCNAEVESRGLRTSPGLGEVSSAREPREGDQRRGRGTPRTVPVAGGLSNPPLPRTGAGRGKGGGRGGVFFFPPPHPSARAPPPPPPKNPPPPTRGTPPGMGR